MPDFHSKPKGLPSKATGLAPGIISKANSRKALQDLLSMEPLCMSKQEYKELHITTHSPHGSGADMARFMGVGRGWLEPHARQLGHWRRDRNAPQEGPAKVPGAPRGRGVPAGAPCVTGAMSLRYSQGEGRKGERQEQLEVRTRMVRAVREGLSRFGRPWTELPPGTEDWHILLETSVLDETPISRLEGL